ncbi:DsrE family protein [Pacificimonas sp. WHA3]|uniref:DsrE family protein n=2 Tax=Pacificimonas pallii TaxID=2827236 RepID=A0ABS6SFZ9_9SPHN|nr:DsrE family protein [Pacificimonas pallii]
MRRGLSLLVAEGTQPRLHAALSLAVASAALGRAVAIFFQGSAVAALEAGRVWPADAAHRAAGSPTIADLFANAREMEIGIGACETGIHLANLSADRLIPGVETTGLIAFLAAHGDDEIVMA